LFEVIIVNIPINNKEKFLINLKFKCRSLKKLIEYIATNEDTNVIIDIKVDTYISNLNDQAIKSLLN
jgi:hypothetical protein